MSGGRRQDGGEGRGITQLEGAYNETIKRFDTGTLEQQRRLTEYLATYEQKIRALVGDLGGDIDNLGDNLSTRIVEAVAVSDAGSDPPADVGVCLERRHLESGCR